MADLRGPFRGSDTVRAGLVTRDVLRGPRFRKLGVDVFAAAELPSNLANRSRGVALKLNGDGVLSGYSAAELLGSGCVPGDPSVEVTVSGGDFRERPGLVEYDGRGHLKQWQQEVDAHRANRLDDCDWSVLRFTSPDVYGYPDEMFARVQGSVARRSRLLLP